MVKNVAKQRRGGATHLSTFQMHLKRTGERKERRRKLEPRGNVMAVERAYTLPHLEYVWRRIWEAKGTGDRQAQRSIDRVKRSSQGNAEVSLLLSPNPGPFLPRPPLSLCRKGSPFVSPSFRSQREPGNRQHNEEIREPPPPDVFFFAHARRD